MTDRNFEVEARDNDERLYRYGADHLVREFFLRRIIESKHGFSTGSKILEIGSHDGSMTAQILQYVNKIDVLEPVIELHQTISDSLGDRVTIHSGTIENAVFEEDYDAIFLVHVLEHIDNPVESLTQIKRWLKPSGFLYLMVPNADALSREIAKMMGLMNETRDVLPGEKLQGHLRTYNLNALTKDVEESGLVIKESGGVLHKPLANFQIDKALEQGIITVDYLEALNEYSKNNPIGSSSIFVVATP